MPETFIGRSISRVEDPRLLTGNGTFVADVRLPGMLHMAVLRSMLPHAVVRGVDAEPARSLSGVVDAFSAADIRQYLKPLPSQRPITNDRLRQVVLATDRVRYVGEPLAVVVAESRHRAEDGVSAIFPALEPLPVVADTSAAGAEEATQIFDGLPNLVLEVVKEAEVPGTEPMGSDVVVEETLKVQRHTSVPLETRGLVARPDSDGGLTVWGVAKMPHFLRAAIAEFVGLPPEKVRIQPVDVGGGFGVRGEIYPEEVLVPLAALRTGQPVSWIEDRREHLLGTNHSREVTWRVRAAARRDGRLVSLEATAEIDVGAYVRPLLQVIAEQTSSNLLGPYRVPIYRCRAKCLLTNKMGIGTVRAPGRFEATFARERIFDLLAHELGMDRIEFRDRNLLEAADYPVRTGLQMFGRDMVYDSGDPRGALQAAAEALDAPRIEGLAAKAHEEGKRVGYGIAPFIESTGAGLFEFARVAVEPPGVVTVRTGTTSMGQGHETTLAQVAADAVGVDLNEIQVVEGNPDDVPRGVGTFGSRTTVMAGNAVWLAGQELRRRIDTLYSGRRRSLGELLAEAGERGVVLDVTEEFRSEDPTYAYGTHVAVVEVDPEVGTVRVLRYVVVTDVGRVINPAVVTGQIQGGVAQGIGGALLEELVYSEDGQPLSTSFMDYLLPSALDTPPIEVVLLDRAVSPRNPLGVKGAGEVGTIGVGAAVANAVSDALKPEGTPILSLPLKPDRLVPPAPAASHPG